MVKPMNVSVARNILIAMLLFLAAACASADNYYFGTYSTLMYNEESGDLNGMEVTIYPTDDGLIVVVYMAEDGLNDVHLAKVKESAGSLLFSVQFDDDEGIANFVLKCTPKSCKGEYVLGKTQKKNYAT